MRPSIKIPLQREILVLFTDRMVTNCPMKFMGIIPAPGGLVKREFATGSLRRNFTKKARVNEV